MTSVDLNARSIKTIGKVASGIVGGDAIIAIDPGTSSTGWCVLRVRPRLGWVAFSGQGTPLEAVDGVAQFLGSPKAGMLAIEEPAFIGQGRQWMLAWTGGRLAGMLSRFLVSPDDEWAMTPQVWRRALGFRTSSDGSKVDALAFARARGMDCMGPGGGDQVDRAMAVGIAFAAYRICASVAGAGAALISPAEKGNTDDHVRDGKDSVPIRRRQKSKEASQG